MLAGGCHRRGEHVLREQMIETGTVALAEGGDAEERAEAGHDGGNTRGRPFYAGLLDAQSLKAAAWWSRRVTIT